MVQSCTSRLNKTPPIGEPKATDIPDAAAADMISRFRADEKHVSKSDDKRLVSQD